MPRGYVGHDYTPQLRRFSPVAGTPMLPTTMIRPRPALLGFATLATLLAMAAPGTAGARMVDRPAARATLAQGGATSAATRKIRKPTWLTSVQITEYYP